MNAFGHRIARGGCVDSLRRSTIARGSDRNPQHAWPLQCRPGSKRQVLRGAIAPADSGRVAAQGLLRWCRSHDNTRPVPNVKPSACPRGGHRDCGMTICKIHELVMSRETDGCVRIKCADCRKELDVVPDERTVSLRTGEYSDHVCESSSQ